jgi:GGDEF domain-containing protein
VLPRFAPAGVHRGGRDRDAGRPRDSARAPGHGTGDRQCLPGGADQRLRGRRDAFYERTATLLAARQRDDDRYLVLVIVNIDGFSLITGMSGERGGNLARVAVGSALRSCIRHNAVIAHVSEDDFVIADTFTTPDASPLVERVRSAVSNTPSRLTTSVGVVSTPLRPLMHLPPDDVVDEVMTIATAAMFEARKAGGNRARFVVNPALSVLANPDSSGRE